MAGAAKLSIRSSVRLFGVVTALSIGYGITKVNLKNALLNTITGPGSTSRIIAILLVLANLKNLPFVWHVRVLSAIFKHMEFAPKALFPAGKGPSLLFQPLITTSHSPLMETDYNMHKSNSTYFSDLDVTRSNVICCLLRDGIRKLEFHPESVIGPDGKPAKGKWGIMLGGVHCSFKREIKPYETYEMWSRILCWDRKWIYVVTHFVKKGAVRPSEYSLSPPSKGLLESIFGSRSTKAIKGAKKELATVKESAESARLAALNNLRIESTTSTTSTGTSTPLSDPLLPVPHSAIFASAISKYVMKLGRLTIHPEVAFNASGLLPEKPGGWNTMSGTTHIPENQLNGSANGFANGAASGRVEGVLEGQNDTWDYKRILAENARGMRYAEHFAALDGLHETFTGVHGPALGVWKDII